MNQLLQNFLILVLIPVIFVPKLTAASRPNIIVIISDDQRYDQISPEIIPSINKYVVSKGTNFTKGYVTSPACCPSRASILTGRYNSKNKVYGNEYMLPEDQITFPQVLKQSGYFTGHIGKYLNRWDGSKRPEYDFWLCNQGAMVEYLNPTLIYENKTVKFNGYISDIYAQKAIEFLELSQKQSKPFLLYFAPNAPHNPATPSEVTKNLFNNYALPKYPNFNRADSGKPQSLLKRKRLNKKGLLGLENLRRNQLRTLRALDDAMLKIFLYLEGHNLFENTAIFYISDNGVFHGEFGLKNKDKVYEPAIHVPFFFRYDQLSRTPIDNSLAANIDIAPTIYEIAKIQKPPEVDGTSLTKLPSQRSIIIESWGNRSGGTHKAFYAIHNGSSILIANQNDTSELYDLDSDPYQMKNLYYLKQHSEIKDSLEQELHDRVYSMRGSLDFDIPMSYKVTKIKKFRDRKHK